MKIGKREIKLKIGNGKEWMKVGKRKRKLKIR